MKLELKKLSKRYGDKNALQDFSCEMTEGIYALLGPNGAGKSTLIHILTGNMEANTGEIFLDGEPIQKCGRDYRRQIGYVPQIQCYYDNFSLYEYLSYIGTLKNLNKNYLKSEIPKVMQAVNMLEFAKKKLGSFSGGMKQRAMIAQAILGDPNLLILDEPTAGLDPEERVRIRNLLGKIGRKKIVLYATHVVSDVELIADKILLLKDGRLIKNNQLQELQDQIKGKVFEATIPIDQIPEFGDIYRISQIYRQSERYGKIRLIAEQKPTEIRTEEVIPSLDEIYIYFCRSYK